MSLLSITDLHVQYDVPDGVVRAVDGVSFDIEPETIVGVLGESGCGKSTLSKSIVRALPDNGAIRSGEIRFDGRDLSTLNGEAVRQVRWDRIAYVPQSAMGSLDPVCTIEEQLVETITAHRPDTSRRECLDRAGEVLDLVGISPSRLSSYPHELSGGMRQRVLLAMSLLLEPDLIIADEPTTGLDVLIRDKILNDIEMYRDEFGISVLMVSHDIADLVETSDEMIVMYGGKIVEQGPAKTLFDEAVHPYTMGLRGSLPELHDDPEDLIEMKMEPPDLQSPPEGCRFVNKCPFVTEECTVDHPGFVEAKPGVESACYRATEASALREKATTVSWKDD
ncbi:ABC transporter ATP-binding protein [Natrarchaeobaculum aegyptiacum]|uniref:ABC transporter domain-containing protein n=1 Tax=Natrarchaeobaculum aegyptiacum TaxID=745377 RepID=A0A2Z2I1B5_9EURY|nr:ABC transporter ATP-binding protein [Natrarchaeobaculum aegyptiacum]ARS90198.1 hypothetical protein B1756_11000 [Natrarchaeobaculum aegyptiacum]